MLTGKEYHCSVGYEVFSGIFNILGEGVAGVGRAWGVRCGYDIEGYHGGGGRQWEEKKEEEECSSLDCHHFGAILKI